MAIHTGEAVSTRTPGMRNVATRLSIEEHRQLVAVAAANDRSLVKEVARAIRWYLRQELGHAHPAAVAPAVSTEDD